jgi:hypothetical protein
LCFSSGFLISQKDRAYTAGIHPEVELTTVPRTGHDERRVDLLDRTRRSFFGFVALIVLLPGATPASGAALALAMAVDVSASVTADSYLLQRDGIARAFEDRRLIDAIAAIPGGIEVSILEWSDPDKIAVTVGWTRVADGHSAGAFAAAARASRRSSSGLTAIGPALIAAASTFDHLPEPAERRIIDISGDGMANFGGPPAVARDSVVAAGFAINGLAILTEEPWLEAYYRSNVIGGPLAFVIAAKDFDSFANAMLRKLVQEVAGIGPARSDAISSDRREAVEPDRGIACGVGAGRQDLDLVADPQPERQPILGPLIENVCTIASRPGKDDGTGRAAAVGGGNPVFDALVHRFR